MRKILSEIELRNYIYKKILNEIDLCMEKKLLTEGAEGELIKLAETLGDFALGEASKASIDRTCAQIANSICKSREFAAYATTYGKCMGARGITSATKFTVKGFKNSISIREAIAGLKIGKVASVIGTAALIECIILLVSVGLNEEIKHNPTLARMLWYSLNAHPVIFTFIDCFAYNLKDTIINCAKNLGIAGVGWVYLRYNGSKRISCVVDYDKGYKYKYDYKGHIQQFKERNGELVSSVAIANCGKYPDFNKANQLLRQYNQLIPVVDVVPKLEVIDRFKFAQSNSTVTNNYNSTNKNGINTAPSDATSVSLQKRLSFSAVPAQQNQQTAKINQAALDKANYITGKSATINNNPYALQSDNTRTATHY